MKLIYVKLQEQEDILLSDLVYLGYYLALGSFKADRLFDYVQSEFQHALEQEHKEKVLQHASLSHYI